MIRDTHDLADLWANITTTRVTFFEILASYTPPNVNSRIR